MTNSEKMLPAEKRAALSLALVYVFRMMGLFMVLPVLSLYVDRLPGATVQLVGVALGIYGLTQAALQVPFGLLSDRFGRKPIILFGLLLFFVGSIVAALADNIWLLIAGRALQGSGAIAAAMMALAADLSRDSQRTKVMAIIGASIGGAFLLSLMIGPLLSSWFGVAGLFWFTAVLSIISILVIALKVPTPLRASKQASFKWSLFKSVATDKNLLKLDFSIFSLHGILSALFVVVPFVLRDQLDFDQDAHWKVYLPVMMVSLAIAIPFIRRSSREQPSIRLLQLSVLGLMGSVLLMGLGYQYLWVMALGLTLFFAAFNLLEASLPAFISRLAPVDFKGTALGVYSTSQFFGTFLGSVAAGTAMAYWSFAYVMALIGGWLLVWALILAKKIDVKYELKSCAIDISHMDKQAAGIDELSLRPEVVEIVVSQPGSVAYIRYRGDKNLEQEYSRIVASL